MKYIIHTPHRLVEAVIVTNIADMKFQFRIIQHDAHLFLLFLITAEDPYLAHLRRKETLEDGIPERPRTAGDHQYFAFEHNQSSLFICVHQLDQIWPIGCDIARR